MLLREIITPAPGGKAQLKVSGVAVTFLLPYYPRDIHDMRWYDRWIANGAPGITLRSGIGISPKWLALMTVIQIIGLILHETTHWWQLWRRMGPNDFPAGYIGQILAKVFAGGNKTLHDRINIEKEAQDAALAMWNEVLRLLATSQPVVFDVEAWLQAHYPAMR